MGRPLGPSQRLRPHLLKFVMFRINCDPPPIENLVAFGFFGDKNSIGSMLRPALRNTARKTSRRREVCCLIDVRLRSLLKTYPEHWHERHVIDRTGPQTIRPQSASRLGRVAMATEIVKLLSCLANAQRFSYSLALNTQNK